jgi:hypothetical protein
VAISLPKAFKHWGLVVQCFDDNGRHDTTWLYHANDVNGKLKATKEEIPDLEDFRKKPGVNVNKLLHH